MPREHVRERAVDRAQVRQHLRGGRGTQIAIARQQLRHVTIERGFFRGVSGETNQQTAERKQQTAQVDCVC